MVIVLDKINVLVRMDLMVTYVVIHNIIQMILALGFQI